MAQMTYVAFGRPYRGMKIGMAIHTAEGAEITGRILNSRPRVGARSRLCAGMTDGVPGVGGGRLAAEDVARDGR